MPVYYLESSQFSAVLYSRQVGLIRAVVSAVWTLSLFKRTIYTQLSSLFLISMKEYTSALSQNGIKYS